ncbi:MAG: hypothetical protein MMC33_004182 [Icmadophila ericetorum]|nr:hypothetical protein [Icmadophila ericetorum]
MAPTNGVEAHERRTHVRSNSGTPSTSPASQHIKRNSSNVSLPRTGSKVSMKKNASNTSLKRNGSPTKLDKTSRPTTPLRRSQQQRDRNGAKEEGGFSFAGDGQEDEWTEESNSQSPEVTRRNSIANGLHTSKDSPPNEDALRRTQVKLPDSPPESPSSASDKEPVYPKHEPNMTARYYPNHAAADAVTSRLLSHKSSRNLPPQVSDISAGGTPRTQTPPTHSNQDSLPSSQSVLDNGVSRFINNSNNSSETGHPQLVSKLNGALNSHNLKQKNARSSSRVPSPSPPNDPVRRAKSAHNLIFNTSQLDESRPSSPPSYTIPTQPKRPGGNTQAKLDLWRTQANVDPAPGPPTAIIQGFQGMSAGRAGNVMGMEERCVKIWDGAESEIGHLRRFRNPVAESADKVLKRVKKGKQQDQEREQERVRRRGAGEVSRPGSAAASRSERLGIVIEVVAGREVEPDRHEGQQHKGSEEEALHALLRRMWDSQVMEPMTDD